MSLRMTLLFGIAAIAFAVLGSGLVDAQAVEAPAEELPEGFNEIAEQYTPEGWTPGAPHPGQTDFESYCAACHSLGENTLVGPGLQGLWGRIQAGPEYEGKNPYERVLEYVNTVDMDDPAATKDPYFQEVQQAILSPGVDMTTRGGLPASADDRRILNVIDYIFRFRAQPFNEDKYLGKVELGRSLVSGSTRFKWGGPSCITCHSIGSDPHLRGASVAPPITHTYVLARQLGSDEDTNYSDGLYEILSGEDAPAMHYFYEDVEGSRPLTDVELEAVVTFFEVEARETGTEQDSNYLPILALIFAALGILLLEPGVVNLLFTDDDHEYVDGPYEGQEHHGEAHGEPPPGGGSEDSDDEATGSAVEPGGDDDDKANGNEPGEEPGDGPDEDK